MKAWHMTCEACKRTGPTHQAPVESVRLGEAEGWGTITRGIVRLQVCPECKADPERAFARLGIASQSEPKLEDTANLFLVGADVPGGR